MFAHRKKNIFFFLVILMSVSVFLRFYNLNWGAPFYFHPDERNIASSVSQLSFPAQMNPHFFAYGSLPIYAIYFTGVLINFFSHMSFPLLLGEGQGEVLGPVTFDQAILISRFYSALFSTLLIPLLFVIARKFTLSEVEGKQSLSTTGLPRSPDLIGIARNDSVGLIAAFLASFSVGFIQFAHFGTFEMWLTFFSTLLLWLCLKLLESGKIFIFLLLGVVLGILIATKVSHLVLLPLPLLALLFQKIQWVFKRSKISVIARSATIVGGEAISIAENFSKPSFIIPAQAGIHGSRIRSWMTIVKELILFFTITTSVYLLTNPFVLLDYSSFLGSMKYESEVALGTPPVFYTGEFINAIPLVFQFLHVYPFLLNPVLTILLIPSLLYVLFITIKHKNTPFLLLVSCFLFLFLSQAFLYAKWTRYMVPTIPSVYLICAVAFTDLWRFLSRKEIPQPPLIKGVPKAGDFILILLVGSGFIFAASYFITVFIHEDTRIAAKNFAKQYILSNAPILSEVYDMGITPFNDSYPNITLYNFYDLDPGAGNTLPPELISALEKSEYIILPSQRLLKTRLRNAKAYPGGHAFYSALLAQVNGFQKIYETPCDIFCKITYLGSPVYSFEETANVFDRPTVFIFKKNDN